MSKFTYLLLFTLILFISQNPIHSQNTFKVRSKFTLPQNVTQLKFTNNYDTLVLIKQNDHSIYQYNPFTFELNGYFYIDSVVTPKDFQLFGTDILVVTEQNKLIVFQRKLNSTDLNVKQTVDLQTNSTVTGIRLQKLNQDFDGGSTLTATRHVVVLFKKGFQVYKYNAVGDSNKLNLLFQKNIDGANQTLVDAQFFDQKFLIYAVDGGSSSSINLIQLNATGTVKRVSTKLAYSIKAFRAKTSTNYLAISYASGVGQWKTQKNVNITQSGKQITPDISHAKLFFDSNRLLGAFNQTALLDFRVSDNFTDSYPSYTDKIKEFYNATTPKLTHIAVPANNTGDFISNNCQDSLNCWNYYALCDVSQYYAIQTILTVKRQVCKKCTGVTNCQKCPNDVCVKCLDSYFINSTKKCEKCTDKIKGCSKCSQDGGKTCYQCDKNNFYPQPISNECMCKSGTFWNQTSKACVSCQTKVPFCTMCLPVDNSNVKCYICDETTNRKIDNSTNKCICDNFYFQNSSKLCQACDSYQKCTTCVSTQNCTLCNAAKHWSAQPMGGKCVCQNKYVQVQNQCQLCVLMGCLKCQNQQVCSQCEDGYVLDPVKKTCSCAQNRFYDQASNSCKLCSDSIPGCFKCSNGDKCDTCDQNKNRNVQPNADGKCDCKSQYTQNDNKQCVLCTVIGCSNCQQQNYCSTCIQSKGFNAQPQDGKCSCKQTLYLEQDVCVSCSTPLVGCQSCKDKTACDVCNSSASFDPNPVNGSCKCIQNNFVRDQQCVTCQRLCQHCQQCIQSTTISSVNILTEQIFKDVSKSVYCLKCDDDFQLNNNQCVTKSSNAIYFILGGAVVLAIVIVIFIIKCIRKRADRKLKDIQSQRQKDQLMVSMLLKSNSSQIIASDRSSKQKKNYEPIFSGNINYSISSQQRLSDTKSFNDSLKQYDKQRQNEYNKKRSKQNQRTNYTDLNSSINKKKVSKKQKEAQDQDMMRQNLFGRQK